jgi:gluconate 2-dehydrogenase alpha chain
MATQRPKADVVIVGLGWSGSLMAEELTRAGLNVVAIERGAWRDTTTDFPPSVDTDELRWTSRRGMLQPPAVETLTFRNDPSQKALPVRDWSCYQFGWNVGGAGTHWAGMTWRFSPYDFQAYSETVRRYGKHKFTDGLQVQDWGVTYDDLEPYYDRFERIAGTSGKAGNLRGQLVDGGNVFEGARQRDYPTPPLQATHWMQMYEKTTRAMGYHPFPIPAGNISTAYVNPLGVRMAPCTYCGYCEFYGCGNWSKSSPQACVLPALMQRENFQVVTETEVLRINKAADGKTATGVTCIDRNNKVWEQPADIVIVSAYQMDNVRLLLLSGIGRPYDPSTGKGVVGRNYTYQTISGADLYFENERFNPFIGAGALGVQIDDFNGDNFDHSHVDFIGGAGIMGFSTNGRPIGMADSLPPGSKRWGSAWKRTFQHSYQNNAGIFAQGTSYGHRDVYLSLDPVYKDRHGQPLLRVTFDYNENDRRMAKFMMDKSAEIGKKAGAKHVVPYNSAAGRNSPADQRSSHTIGGAVMGMDPNTSALNRYLQSWDVHNVFVMGASAFPQGIGYNPTGLVAALAYWSAKAIRNQYLKNPGPLVSV